MPHGHLEPPTCRRCLVCTFWSAVSRRPCASAMKVSRIHAPSGESPRQLGRSRRLEIPATDRNRFWLIFREALGMTVSHAATQRRRRPPPTAPGATPPTPPTPSGALLEPLLPPTRLGPRPRWPARGDHRRDVVDAIRYVAHNGCVWRALPADFPPWRTVYGFYWRWNASGATAWLHNRLRARCRGVRLVWADAAYAGRLVAWAAALRLASSSSVGAWRTPLRSCPAAGSSSGPSPGSAGTAARSATTSGCPPIIRRWSSGR